MAGEELLKLIEELIREVIEEERQNEKQNPPNFQKPEDRKPAEINQGNVITGKRIPSPEWVFKMHPELRVKICSKLQINKQQYRQVMKLLQRLGLCEVNMKGAYMSADTFSRL